MLCGRRFRRGCARPGDEFLEGRLVADGIEVGVAVSHFAAALPHVDRLAQVVEGVGGPAGRLSEQAVLK